MKSKKGIIILSAVVIACAVGFIVSPLVNWPVDSENASSNIAKSSRFSRKTADEGLSNMEELLANDEDYKNGIATAYIVMRTRAAQFGSLVDMSNEVAGGIPVFADVLKDMNEVREMISNVNASLAEAGEDLNAVLGGENRPGLAQNTINASLAYTTLQKKNNLATRFIGITDKYLETSEGDDRLKFVRDQWLEYQQMTAALEGDGEFAEALAKKGNLLQGEQTLAAMGTFNLANQISVLSNASMSEDLGLRTNLCKAIPAEQLSSVLATVRNTVSAAVQSMETNDNLQNVQTMEALNNSVNKLVRQVTQNVIASQAKENLGIKSRQELMMSTIFLGNAVNVVKSYDQTMKNSTVPDALQQTQQIALGSRVGEVINSTALGKRPKIEP